MNRTVLLRALSALDTARARYVVVGGIAVVLHGHLRTTLDLDLVLELAPDNLTAALGGLAAAGFVPVVPLAILAFADAENRRHWIEHRNMVVFSLWHPDDPAFKVDLFVQEPFSFPEVYERVVWVELEGIRVPVANVDDLIALKLKAGRPQDLADVEALGKLRP